ncbi:nucleotide sugar dehydrogenase [Aestuariivirga sp.]|uniref:nucleotide sugar dehydrogenase n=1 Tax=Aestuariivirga sp. TaxID=2650926 RepID=UPI003593C2BD
MLVNTLLVADRGDEPHLKDHLRLITEPPPPLPDAATCRVAVIGLGYVGLPLVLGFAKASRAIGLDISKSKIEELRRGIDFTGEVNGEELRVADADFTTDTYALREADVVIVCVPTPVNSHNRPDYGPLLAASRTIGQHLKRGCVVVFESTVDPGTTEERCLPVIEQVSGLKEGVDFYLGYSPERINPGDPTRKLADIKKIVAGSTPAVTDFLEGLYSRVVNAGLFKATSIRVAEAAKILENTQRDVNIALMNQMMALFDKMGIRSTDVIAAAGSKWNFHHYRPGLVGGHCIAVDPYFLVDAGRRHGLAMELVAAARAVNEQTPHYLVEKLEEQFGARRNGLQGARILVLGRSFKEDCPDTRNSKCFPMMDAMWNRGAEVFNFDPVAFDDHFEGGRGTKIIDDPFAHGPYDAVIVTLTHTVFRHQFDAATLVSLAGKHAPLIDMRGSFDSPEVRDWFRYWRP